MEDNINEKLNDMEIDFKEAIMKFALGLAVGRALRILVDTMKSNFDAPDKEIKRVIFKEARKLIKDDTQ